MNVGAQLQDYILLDIIFICLVRMNWTVAKCIILEFHLNSQHETSHPPNGRCKCKDGCIAICDKFCSKNV